MSESQERRPKADEPDQTLQPESEKFASEDTLFSDDLSAPPPPDESLESENTLQSDALAAFPTEEIDQTLTPTQTPSESDEKTERLPPTDSSPAVAPEEPPDHTLELPGESHAPTGFPSDLSEVAPPPTDSKTIPMSPEEVEDARRRKTDRKPDNKPTQVQPKVQRSAPILSTRPGLHSGMPHIPGYELIREIGQGGMGVVILAKDVRLNRLVALKMIRAGVTARREELKRFHSEARAVAALQHPNIVQIFDTGEANGQPYFSLEFVGGGSLHDVLKKSTGLHPRTSAEIVEVLARGMHYAHENGILHRDLKPANVLIEEGGLHDAEAVPDRKGCRPLRRTSVKITDFGLAKDLNEEVGQTHEGSILGTPSYMAPEQASGKIKELGPPADVYALGAILYDLLASRPPFRADTAMSTLHQVLNEEPVPPRRLHPALDSDLETICLKCLEKDPQKRYQSAEALADDLKHYLHDEPILARPSPLWEKAWKWAKRRPGAASSIVLSCLLIFGLIFGGWWVASEQSERAATEAHLRKQAEIKERRARESRELARQAIDEFFRKLTDHYGTSGDIPEHIRLEIIQRAIDFYQRFARQKPEDDEGRLDLGFTHQRLGEIFERLDLDEKSKKSYQTAESMFRELIQKNPQNARARIALGGALNQMGILALKENRSDQARANHNEALKLLADEVAEAKAAEHREEYLANAHYQLGLIHQKANEPDQAVKEYEKARSGYQKLVQAHPKNLSYRSNLAHTHESLATVAYLSKDVDQALASLKKAVEQLRELRQQDLKNVTFQAGLAKALWNKSVILFSANKHRENRKQLDDDLQEALLLVDGLVKSSSKNGEFRRIQIELLKVQGRLFGQSNGDAKKEADVWEKLTMALEDLHRLDSSIKVKHELAVVQKAYAMALKKQNKKEEAAEYLRLATSTFDEVLKKQPKNERCWDERIDANLQETVLWREVKNLLEAETALESLVTAQKERIKQFPEMVDLVYWLSRWELDWAEVAFGRKQIEKAKTNLLASIEHAKIPVLKSPQTASYHEHLIHVQITGQQYADAVQSIENQVKSVDAKEINFVLAAKKMAFCAKMLKSDEKAKRAVELLNRAKEQKQLKNETLADKAFDNLRNREDFQKLESSIQKPSGK